MNRMKPWTGDLATTGGLLAAIAARAFVHGAGERAELILTLSDLESLDAVLNLHLGFREAGSRPAHARLAMR